MAKKNRKNRSIGVIFAIFLATSALILSGFNTFYLFFGYSSGIQTDSQKSRIRVFINSSYETDTNTVVLLNFTTKSYDLNSDFDLKEDQFVSPQDGYFRFSLYLQMDSLAPLIMLQMYKDGEIISLGFYNNNDKWISHTDSAYLTQGTIVNYTLEFRGDPGTIVGNTNGERTHLAIEEL
jgi:hypothetical protein